MYSEQLEQLIKSVIADGVITEKERAILHKRATAEGIDEDEIDVYVDGLIAQMKSDTSKSKDPVSPNIDFNHVTKIFGTGPHETFCCGQKWYLVNGISDDYIENLYLSFCKETYLGNDAVYHESFGVMMAFIYKTGVKPSDNYPKLVLNIDRNSIQFNYDFDRIPFPLSLKPKNKDVDYSVYFNVTDPEMLKLLCDSNHVTMSLYDIGVEDDREKEQKYDIKEIPVDGLLNYARVFYRSVIDNNAYLDAVIGKNPRSSNVAAIGKNPRSSNVAAISENPQSSNVPMPMDYKMQSIMLIVISVICCGLAGIVNLALGVMALLENKKVEPAYYAGNYELAQAASDKAGKYTKIGFIIFGIGVVLEIIFFFILIHK